MTLRHLVPALFLACLAPMALAAELELVMIEQPGCVYCARWNAEVAPEYPITAEGKAAPLRRLQLRDTLPPDITLSRTVVFTPTFILLSDSVEQDRIEGYPGEDFFWPLLSGMIATAQTQ